jgi:hypothetical protein
MSRLDQLITEIKEIGPEASYRNALQIFKILDANSSLFTAKIDPDYYGTVLKNFEALSASNAREYNSSAFKQDYHRGYELLLFHLNRIL